MLSLPQIGRFLGSTATISILLLATPAQAIKVYFVAGQSNAGGNEAGGASALSAANSSYADPFSGVRYSYTHVDPNGPAPVHAYSSNGFVDLAPVAEANDRHAFELSLGRELFACAGEPVAIIKYSAGGTSMADFWLPENNYLYQDMLSVFNSGLADLTTTYGSAEIGGMFWHQGESDAYLYGAPNYAADFNTFAGQLRTDLGESSLPIVLGMMNEVDALDQTSIATLNAALTNIAASDSNITTTGATDDISLFDGVHLDADGQIELGLRYADAYKAAFVPEPSSAVLALIAGLGAVARRRR